MEVLRSSPASGAARGRAPLPLVAGLSVAAMLLIAALLLWASYGTTVFFEMMAAGLAACF